LQESENEQRGRHPLPSYVSLLAGFGEMIFQAKKNHLHSHSQPHVCLYISRFPAFSFFLSTIPNCIQANVHSSVSTLMFLLLVL
jgi:hypothetical protein